MDDGLGEREALSPLCRQPISWFWVSRRSCGAASSRTRPITGHSYRVVRPAGNLFENDQPLPAPQRQALNGNAEVGSAWTAPRATRGFSRDHEQDEPPAERSPTGETADSGEGTSQGTGLFSVLNLTESMEMAAQQSVPLKVMVFVDGTWLYYSFFGR